MKPTKTDLVKEAESEQKHTINRVELRGVAQCQSHTWRKLNETEIACEKCPTVHIVSKADDYI